MAYFALGHFLSRAVFLLKPGKDPTPPENYCPLTMLSVLGKLLEEVINNRLIGHNDTLSVWFPWAPQRGNGSPSCLGNYQSACGKRSLVTLVSLDLRGAFDHEE